MSRTCQFVILAAGEGTRMKSNGPKVLHEVAGRTLLGHVIALARQVDGARIAVVIGPAMTSVPDALGELADGVGFHIQDRQLGTAHAVLAAKPALDQPADDVFVLFADTPLVTPALIAQTRTRLAAGADMVVVGFETGKPTGYGRLIGEGDRVSAIVEHKDATEAQRQVRRCNSGIMAFRGEHMLDLLTAIGSDNAQSEFYLTDAVKIANDRGLDVQSTLAGEVEVMGVNTRAQLARCEAVFQDRKRAEVMTAGVTLTAPETVFFSHDTKLSADVTVEPNVVFGPGVTVQSGALIRSFSHIEGAHVGQDTVIGPFARIRPGSRIAIGAKVGNFVETKNAQIEAGAKVNHLSYIGDARVGAASNIGAGTITCNYDGFDKFHTDIGAGAFIGSNSALVAPVKIGDGAYVASGSVITEDVPKDALALGRARQVNKLGRAAEIRKRSGVTSTKPD